MPPDALTEPQRAALLAAFAPFVHHIERVDLFGSRARGGHRVGSDIDLIVQDDGDEDAYLRLLTAIDEADVSVNVDVLRYRDLADGVLADSVARDAVTLFTRDMMRIAQ